MVKRINNKNLNKFYEIDKNISKNNLKKIESDKYQKFQAIYKNSQ